jgi:hypothetical protein
MKILSRAITQTQVTTSDRQTSAKKVHHFQKY